MTEDSPRRTAITLAAASALVTALVGGQLVLGRSDPSYPNVGAGGRSGAATTTSGPSPGNPAALALCPAERPTTWFGRGDGTAVPALPVGFDLRDRLVPDETPIAAVVCRYAPDGFTSGDRQPSPNPLATAVRLTGGLSDLPVMARPAVPRPAGEAWGCTARGGPEAPYLVGLDYTGGRRVWLSSYYDPNSCSGTWNGTFTNRLYLGHTVNRSYEAGRWSAVGTKLLSPYEEGPITAERIAQAEAVVAAFATLAVDPRFAGAWFDRDVDQVVFAHTGDDAVGRQLLAEAGVPAGKVTLLRRERSLTQLRAALSTLALDRAELARRGIVVSSWSLDIPRGTIRIGLSPYTPQAAAALAATYVPDAVIINDAPASSGGTS